MCALQKMTEDKMEKNKRGGNGEIKSISYMVANL